MINPVTTPEGKRFKKIFGKSVLDFWCHITGFDVIKFDKWAQTPDGVSCSDHVEKKFGKGAASIVRAMIQAPAWMDGARKEIKK